MTSKVSTCLYVDGGVLETAKQSGLNISKVPENVLIEAISRLTGLKPETSLKSHLQMPVEGPGRDLNSGARLPQLGRSEGLECFALQFQLLLRYRPKAF